MKRVDLEHVLRAASAITNEREFIVIGSQAILGQFPDAPAELLVSDEVDIYPRHRPDLADLIDGAIGELSFFHDEFGYYAQGVGPTTATLPAGWEARLVAVTNDNTRGAVGHCLELRRPTETVLYRAVRPPPSRDELERAALGAKERTLAWRPRRDEQERAGSKALDACAALACRRGLVREVGEQDDDGAPAPNGPEFISLTLDAWAAQHSVKLDFIQPGKPTQNAHVESFNGHFRDECLAQARFPTLARARAEIEMWRVDYNCERPHSALGYETPQDLRRHGTPQHAAFGGGCRRLARGR